MKQILCYHQVAKQRLQILKLAVTNPARFLTITADANEVDFEVTDIVHVPGKTAPITFDGIGSLRDLTNSVGDHFAITLRHAGNVIDLCFVRRN